MAVIEAKKLTKYYGKARGIIGVDLSINEGDFFGFIGPNGAGKSTTTRSLLGLITPTSGSGTVLGFDCVRQKTQLLSQVGYIPSEAMFYQGMKVSEIITLSARMRRKECSKQAKLLCERFELDTKRKVEELSLGNRKKLSIICALQHEPKLYICDEPTSGLDPLMQREFFEVLKEKNAQGATVFLSSHVLSEIGRHCRHAAVVREGKIIANGTVEELTASTAKRVVLHGIVDVPNLEGMIDVEKNGNHISFLYAGEIPRLISALNGLQIEDMSISEPDLEEMFMHFYGGEQDDNI